MNFWNKWCNTINKALIFLFSLFSFTDIPEMALNDSNFGLSSPIYIVQMHPIDPKWPLSDILDLIQPVIRGVVGIARSADFNRRELSKTLYLYVISYEEAIKIQNTPIELDNEQVATTIVDLSIGRADLDPAIPDLRSRGAPFSLHLSGLERKYVATIWYLREIVRRFELGNEIVNARICYDAQRQRTCTFGFISFLNRSAIEQYHNKSMQIYNSSVKSVVSTNVPLLIHTNQLHLLTNGKAEWNADTREANWLNGDNELDDEEKTEDEGPANEENEPISNNTGGVSVENNDDSEDEMGVLQIDLDQNGEFEF